MNIDVDMTTFLIAIIGMIVAIILGTVGPMITVMVLLHRSHRTDVSNLRDDVKGISERMNKVETTQAELQSDIRAQRDDLKGISERLSKVETTQAELQSDIRAQRDDLKGISERLSKVETTQTEILTVLRIHNGQFDSVNKSLDGQEEHLKEISGDVKKVIGSIDVLIPLSHGHSPVVAKTEFTADEPVGQTTGD